MPAPGRSTSRDVSRGIRAETPPAAGTADNRAALRPGGPATDRRDWRIPSPQPRRAAMSQATHLYAIALGSNRRHIRHGRPAGVVEAAIARLDADFTLFDASPIMINRAIGGAGRDFANAVALVESELKPDAMLATLKNMERDFGRRP